MPTSIPAIRQPDRNRRVLLTSRPAGVPQASDFTIVQDAVPTMVDEGRFLVRNIYLSVDPAQRGWASAEANYSAPVPLGEVMRALAVAVVLESRCDGIASGDYLYGFFGWQDYAVAGPEAILHRAREALPLDAFASLAGINGVTAFLGLTLLGRPQAGESVFVSTAAGSVGSFVGQIARSFGCRTIGLTGTDEKAERCRSRYGYDEAINYRTADIEARIAEAAPKGIDVYFDSVGGTVLDTVLRRMAVAGRIVQCGTASVSSWNPPPTGPRNEREILTRRLVWSGFVIFDHRGRYAEAVRTLADLHAAGSIAYDTDISDDIAHAPGAIAALYAGENAGKKLIFIG